MVDKTKIEFKHFNWDEFDSPDAPGSGYMCSIDLLHKLNIAREHAKCPFKITSGFRTKAYNKDLQKRGYKASVNSSHCKGLAADIAITDNKKRWTIINALIKAGFNRIGISETFCHVDIDHDKQQHVIWTY